MNTVWSSLAIWGVRLVVAVGLYAAIVIPWMLQATGSWDSIGRVFAGSTLGIAAAAAWCVSIIIERLFISNVRLRLITHPSVTTGLFAVFGFAIFVVYMDNSVDDVWGLWKPFGLLVAICALMDAGVGILLARWMIAARGAQ